LDIRDLAFSNMCKLKLPSSLRVLDALGCYSLVASNVNGVISKACCVFAESASQDREDFLQMGIPGKEIPSWFDHQEEGNTVSVSFPSTETIALALYFLIENPSVNDDVQPWLICN
ncbi:hypothetical protein HN51_067355, partial [Arachis hypogaea]